jgi:serine/threonine protein kinase
MAKFLAKYRDGTMVEFAIKGIGGGTPLSSVPVEKPQPEIRLVAGLTHPHILSLHDSGEAQGLLYYVMPFIEGESLRDRLTRDRMLVVAEAVRLG